MLLRYAEQEASGAPAMLAAMLRWVGEQGVVRLMLGQDLHHAEYAEQARSFGCLNSGSSSMGY